MAQFFKKKTNDKMPKKERTEKEKVQKMIKTFTIGNSCYGPKIGYFDKREDMLLLFIVVWLKLIWFKSVILSF